MVTASKWFKDIFNDIDIRDLPEQSEPASQFCIVIQVVDFTNRNVSEIQDVENMGPVIAIQDHMIFIDNDRILKMRKVFKLVGKSTGFMRDDMLMLQQGFNRHNFQFQC